MTRRAPARQARIELPITREGLTAALSATYARLAPFANRPADIQVMGMPSATGAQLGAMLRPISTPLVMNGFEPESAAMLASAFGAAGFTPVVGGAMAQGSAGTQDDDRSAARRRRDRRVARRRRSRNGRDRHDHAHRWRSHLRVRASVLQRRPVAVPDDARLRLRDAAQPDVVVQDLLDGRGHRDDAAGSRDGDRRHARQRARR